MTEKQCFGVLVRALGVFVVLYGAGQLRFVVTRLVYTTGVVRYSLSLDFTYAIIVIALGLIITRWPQSIVRFAFGQETEAPK
jgi:hypothetical protein